MICVSKVWRFRQFYETFSFGSVTVCSEKRIDEDKLLEYLDKNNETYPNETMRERVTNFIQRLATISYDTMAEFPLDIGVDIIKPEEYLDLVSELKWEFVPEISSGTSIKITLSRTVTENGM